MTVTLARSPTQTYADFTSITSLDQAATWPATTAERLIVIITSRAYTGGATRALTVTWGGANVPLVETNFTTPAVAAYDACYWVGELASPSAAATQFRVQTDAATRGLHCVGLFVNGAKSLNAARILEAMARGTSGNTVNLGGTPNMIGSLLAVSTIIAQATTVASFTPGAWTTVQSGLCGPAATATATIRYATTVDTAAVATATQFGAADVQRGGVLVEIQAEPAAAYGVTEAATPTDSVGPLVVAVAMGVTETLTAGDGSSLSVPSNTSPENPVGVWTGAAASWKLPSGADSKGVNNLTASGISAANIKGPGATFTTASYARRTAPALGSPSNLTVEFWCKPTTFGGLWYLGPRVSGSNSARVWIDTAGAWNVSRTTSAGTQSGKSANGTAVLGQTYHVAAVLASGADHKLYANGEAVALSTTGAALTGAFAVGSDDEIAVGLPTLSGLGGFAGDIGRVTVWPIAMSASRIKASYRQQNSLDEWTGLSGENAVSDTNRAPAAVPVHVDLTSGVGQTIDVIGRAYDPDGDALSIQSGSLAPSTGAASIVGDQVFWTPPASFTGAATCGFTLRDGGGKSSPSKVYAQVAAAPSLLYPEAPFAPTSIIVATDAADFAAKYNTTLAAGQHLQLPAGTVALPDGFAFNRTFAAPGVAIVGAGVAANGRDPLTIIPSKDLTVTKDWHAFHQLQFTYSVPGPSTEITVADPFVMRINGAAFFSMTKCWIRGNRGIAFNDDAGCHDNYVGWNRFSTDDAEGAQFCRWALDVLLAGSPKHKNTVFAHNYLRHIGPCNDVNAYAIYIGNGHPGGGEAGIIDGFKVVNNLWDFTAAGWDKAIYLKRGIEEISGNTILNGTQSFNMRHGSLTDCAPASNNTSTTVSCRKLWNNYMDVSDFILQGTGHDVRGNYIKCPKGLAITASYIQNTANRARHEGCSHSLFVRNQIVTPTGVKPYRLGFHEAQPTDEPAPNTKWGGKLRDVKIWGHVGSEIIGSLSDLIFDAAWVDSASCSFSTSLGTYADPGMATARAQTSVGFKITGQNNG